MIELAAIVSLAVQDWQDFGIIVAMLSVNACVSVFDFAPLSCTLLTRIAFQLGFREEYHAKKSLDELSEQVRREP